MPGDAKRCKQIGIRAYLSKPITSRELIKTISAVLMGDKESNFITRYSLIEKREKNLNSERRLNILMAEDNTINQKLAARFIEKMGHKLTIANNGLEAIELYKKNEYNLILMDIQMPEMDGISATTEIRKLEQSSGNRIPIIALTAHAIKGDAERFIAAGMDAYVSKPIDFDKLFEKIRLFGK